ncbi:MAG: ribonuclease E/G, partial [Salaquimonas sp.]
TKEHSIEATALQTNLEAAEEVARQLRLRDLAGLVVIDFIDMEEKRNNRAVERKLKDCLKNDRARIQVGHISHFGLMEMSRQRIRASVLESTMEVCPVCQGVGHVRSQSSFAIHIIRAIDDHMNRNGRFDAVVKVAPATAMFILNNKRQAVSELESRHGVNISFESDYHMQAHDFTVEKGAPATRIPAPQKAVNPMDFDTDVAEAEADAPEIDNSQSANNNSNGSDNGNDDEDRGRGRNKRRRGRGRNRGRDRDDNNQPEGQTSAASSEENNTSSDAENISDADALADVEKGSVHVQAVEASENTETPAKEEKPSRGRRPGKGSSNNAEKTDEPVSEVKKVSDEKIAQDQSDEEASQEPKRRIGRPGKKAKTAEEKSEVSSDSVSEKPSTGPAGAPPREVQRRNTKRVRKPKEETSSEDSDDSNIESFGSGFLN